MGTDFLSLLFEDRILCKGPGEQVYPCIPGKLDAIPPGILGTMTGQCLTDWTTTVALQPVTQTTRSVQSVCTVPN